MSKTRKKNINENLLSQINQLRDSRDNAIDKFYLSFLLNMYRQMSFREKVKEIIINDPELQITALSYSMTHLVSCWETFFRDILVFIINSNNDVKQKLLNDIGEDKKEQLIELDMVGDYFSKLYNFQNLDEIREAFKAVIEQENIFECVGDYIIPYFKDGKVYKFSLNHSFSKWFIYIENIFNDRHRIVHDANYKTRISITEFEKAEDGFLYYPQIFSIWLTQQYKMSTNILYLHNDGYSLPTILEREQIIGDWNIVE